MRIGVNSKMADETTLPREVPYDDQVPEAMREEYIRVVIAAEVTGVPRETIARHLRKGTLAGMKMSPRLWYVKRHTASDDEVPAIDMWTTGPMGNPNWIKKVRD
jgi:hypothetical protein